MINVLRNIQDSFNNHTIPLLNPKLGYALKDYSFFNDFKINNLDQNQNILERVKKSKIISVNMYKNADDFYFIVVFEKTILIINQYSNSFLKYILTQSTQLKICFLKDSKLYFDKCIQIEYEEEKNKYSTYINFNLYIENPIKNQIFVRILSCIIEYLIQKSYYKLLEKNRIKDFCSKKNQIKTYNEDDFIKLNDIGFGSSFRTKLIYLIEEESLLLLKENLADDTDFQMLVKREKECYLKLNHPLIPKLYGTTNNNIIIEYISGSTLLLLINKCELNDNDKISIIFQIMIIIKYFHDNNMILRDLKPNNIMVDHNKTVVFIDFDHVISIDNIIDYENVTCLMSIYIAPEHGKGKFTFKSDIYSLGKIIYYIMTNKEPEDETMKQYNDFGKHSVINEIYKKSINENPNERNNIDEIIYQFYTEYHSQIKIDHLNKIFKYNIAYFDQLKNNTESEINKNGITYLGEFFSPSRNKTMNCYMLNENIEDPNTQYEIMQQAELSSQDRNKIIQYYTKASDQNHTEAQYNLGMIYYEGKYIQRDIQKAIHYLTLAADKNDIKSQFTLSIIYFEGKYIQRDIQKSIHYLTLAANNNYPDAQNNLGSFYYEGEYIQQDINKAIYYFTLAANQNQRNSQYHLGFIYYEGKYIKQDIQKAIYYYTLAANQYHHEAQFRLGYIYFEGKYISQDINKALYYISLSAKQNDIDALNFLGSVYYEGKYLNQDINKAIHYYSIAASQNHSYAQFNLGKIFYDGEYVTGDINKSIHYYSLSAKNNCIHAQKALGNIYYNGKYDTVRDIQKAIYYFSLAANQNDMESQLNLGDIYYFAHNNLRDIDKAIHYYSMAANQNNVKAQLILGSIYENGIYIQRDIKRAIQYYSLAANQNNNQEAQFILGSIYEKGIYVHQDIKKAIHYYSLSANQNNVKAQINLGKIYHSIKYNMQDMNKAIKYYLLAANQNDPEAQTLLGLIYFNGKYVKQDINKAIRYYSLAANQNYPVASNELGYIYSTSRYVQRDMKKAIHYYLSAANKNYSNAQYKIGVFYYKGQYINQNTEKAIHYLSLAANQNNPDAQSFLGYIYYIGKYSIYNISKAIYYLSLGANQNNAVAQYLLGNIYYYGYDVPKNIKKAIYYYSLASNQNDSYAQYKLWEIEYKNQNVNKALNYLNNSALNGHNNANFVFGFMKHQGKYIQRNIQEAIKFYKEASCFYNQFAKNNLGILYKNGFENLIDKNIEIAIEYFKEGIRYKNDKICKYNLSHIYLYEDMFEKNLDESIELLIDLYKQYFTSSKKELTKILLCLSIIKKYGYDIYNIENLLSKHHKSVESLPFSVIESIKDYGLNFESVFLKLYEKYHKIDFLYNEKFKEFPSYELNSIDKKANESKEHLILCINKDFYQGFGIDLTKK